jgi:hypothetical protein
MKVFEAAIAVGLTIAYCSAIVGLMGLLGARQVSLYALSGGLVALIGTVGYFVMSDREIRRRFKSAG